MITRLGLVGSLLIAVGILLLLRIIPIGEPFRSLLFIVLLMSVGALALFKTDEVISPIFASSRLNLWVLKAIGLFFLLLGVAGLMRLGGEMLGFW